MRRRGRLVLGLAAGLLGLAARGWAQQAGGDVEKDSSRIVTDGTAYVTRG